MKDFEICFSILEKKDLRVKYLALIVQLLELQNEKKKKPYMLSEA